jgi:hypothetical protein
MQSWRGIHWWPTPGSTSFGADVPIAVADAYGEGLRCLSVGAPNGAVAMFRTALTWIVNDKGSQAANNKGDLKDKVKQMVGLLPHSVTGPTTFGYTGTLAFIPTCLAVSIPMRRRT